MIEKNNNTKLKHEIHEQIFSSRVVLPMNKFTSVIIIFTIFRSQDDETLNA